MKIKFQQQPTSNTCTSACLAMITGIPIDQVIAEYHDAHVSRDACAHDYLTSKGIEFSYGTTNAAIRGVGLYLLCVPSLNIEGGLHSILYAVWKDKETGQFFHQVADPNTNKENKKYYIAFNYDGQPKEAVEVGGLVIDLCIPIDDFELVY